ncbi:MAG TPA: CvpA family protein [Candidatus Saccharimonadia bacterium]|jgi:uncharacterized protein YkwD|nr:CvpA family protein [Candidatus Saccharimonadia bacterium]
MNAFIGPLIDLVVVGAIIFSAVSGAERGMVLIALELVSFIMATTLAFAAYHFAGAAVTSLTHATAALGNIAGFVIVWVITEVACALLIRFTILPHLHRNMQLSAPNRAGGSILNALKTAAIIALGLSIFAGLPLSAATKQPVAHSLAGRAALAATGALPRSLTTGLSRDLTDSLNFFTVTAEPESEERIKLGFTTTEISMAPQAEADMLVMLNHERTSRGLKPLTLNVTARAVARAYSADMFARGYFSHINPEGKSPFDRMRAGGVDFGSAGENLALAPTLQLAHDGLMKSPGHRANILNPNFHTVGIGIQDGGPYGLMITQDFTD